MAKIMSAARRYLHPARAAILLTDAEVCKDPVKDLLRRCPAGDLPKGVQSLADLQGDELRGEAAGQAIAGTDKSLRRLFEGGFLMEMGDHRLRRLRRRRRDDEVADRRGEAVDPVAIFRGDPNGRGRSPAKEPLQRFLFEALGKVGFVQDREQRFCCHFCEELPVVRRQVRAPVKEDEDGVGRLQPLPDEVDPLLFDGVFRRPEPGGVGQTDGDPPEINGLLDEVPRRPRNGSDDRPLFAEEAV